MAGTGKVVSPFYDSLIIQIICHGKDRNDAVTKMLAYLQRVTIHGISTNISLIKRILVDQIFLDGVYDTTFLPKFLQRTDVKSLIAEAVEASGTQVLDIDIEMLKIEGSDELKVLSPSTGIFYRTPSPTEPDFVLVGDVVAADHTLCQLEAMKMFTPVNLNSFSGDKGEVYETGIKYEVIRINIASGQQVNEGDLLFVIKPLVAEQ
jgi:acetyl/propionyl-CoA carboxylase alpha subunit